jgi:hypothetical protein
MKKKIIAFVSLTIAATAVQFGGFAALVGGQYKVKVRQLNLLSLSTRLPQK